MRLSVVNIIFRKEIKEMLRDKRTIFVTFILPIIMYPLLIFGIMQITIMLKEKIKKDVFEIYVSNSAHAPELMEIITNNEQLAQTDISDPDSALVKGELDLLLRIPENFGATIESGGSDTISIAFSAAEERSQVARTYLEELIVQWELKIVAERMLDAGLDSAITNPVRANYKNVASKERMGAFAFGGVLAFIIVIMVVVGAYYPSVDLVAGEKERGTLETLLVSPAGRGEIVAGKYLAVMGIAVTNALLNLGSLGLTFSLGMSLLPGSISNVMQISLTSTMLFVIFLVIVPLAALFSALFLALSSFAKTYKEAQSYLTPVMMAAQFPAMAALLPGLSLTTKTAFIPMLNTTLLFKDMMAGKAGIVNIAIVLVVTIICAALALRWATSILTNEELMLSTETGSIISKIFHRKFKE